MLFNTLERVRFSEVHQARYYIFLLVLDGVMERVVFNYVFRMPLLFFFVHIFPCLSQSP